MMDSVERVEGMSEKEALLPVFKKLNELKKVGHLEQEMFEDIEVMLAGYFHYREGVDIMATKMSVREGINLLFPEAKIMKEA